MICTIRPWPAVLFGWAAVALAGCGGGMNLSGMFGGSQSPPPPVTAGGALPPSVRPEEIVGRWGLAAFHRPEDRARTETAALNQCSQPYVINRSSTGVAMLGHDSPAVQEMELKGGPDGKTYVGPGPEPAGADDREIVSFDGRVMILRWVDQEVAGRYGTMVLVRCGAEGTKPARPKRAAR
jgi:hypothetical protein